MNTSPQARGLVVGDFVEGRKFRVVMPGASLQGMKPTAPYVRQGWSMPLAVGTVLVCAGRKMSFGDGAPIVQWLDENGQWLANDCEVSPRKGGLWDSLPADGYLAAID